MNAESLAIVGTLVAAIVAAWVALKKQKDADETSSSKRWRLYARHVEEVNGKLEADNAVLRRQQTEDAVTIARLTDRTKRLEEESHAHDEPVPERGPADRDGHAGPAIPP